MDKTEGSAVVELPERLLFKLDAITLGAYIKLKWLCSKEPDGIAKKSWNDLTVIGISQSLLTRLQAPPLGLIRWMQNRNMQLIQMMEP